jgi:heme/copper-type cytochrome/quinol oxidase subunit 4
MYMLPFLALTIIGAFVAWRQNPMYSFGRTVRFLLVLGLAVATVIVAIVAVINLTTGKSQTVQLTAIFTVTGVATLALIGLIIQMSLPAGVALPKGMKLVRFHRAKVDVWAKRAGWTILALALLAIVLPTTGKIIVGTLGGFVVFLSIVMLFGGYMSARKMDQWLTEVELRPWVHWTYTAEQWSAWNAERVHEVEITPPTFIWRKHWWKLALALAGIAQGVFLFSPADWIFNTCYVAGIGAVLFGLALLSTRTQKNDGARAGSKLKAATPEVYFGSEGLFVDATFLPWISAGVYLITAGPGKGEPAHLSFQFMKIEANSSSVVNQGVLLPANASGDVAKLQQELTAKCPKAVIDLV